MLEIHGNLVPVALSTGVKCTPYDRLSRHGDVLHDCHAEVLTRRATRSWILRRLVSEQEISGDNVDGLPRLFIPSSSSANKPQWRLRPEAHLHFYVSTLPCTYPFCSLKVERRRQSWSWTTDLGAVRGCC